MCLNTGGLCKAKYVSRKQKMSQLSRCASFHAICHLIGLFRLLVFSEILNCILKLKTLYSIRENLERICIKGLLGTLIGYQMSRVMIQILVLSWGMGIERVMKPSN